MNRRSFFGRVIGAIAIAYFGKWPRLDHFLAVYAPAVPHLDRETLLGEIEIHGPISLPNEPFSVRKALLTVDVQNYSGEWEHVFIAGDTPYFADDSERWAEKKTKNLKHTMVAMCDQSCDQGFREVNGRRIPFKAINFYNRQVDANQRNAV